MEPPGVYKHGRKNGKGCADPVIWAEIDKMEKLIRNESKAVKQHLYIARGIKVLINKHGNIG